MNASESPLSLEQKLRDLEIRLKKLDAERSEVVSSIEELRLVKHRMPQSVPVAEMTMLGQPILSSPPLTPDEKTAVFLKLF